MMPLTKPAHAQVTKKQFGQTQEGTPVELYTLKSGKVEVEIMTYGGIVRAIRTPDRDGNMEDIVLGFDALEGYLACDNKPYFGALIGRYANRIALGTFWLEGKRYLIPKNNGDNSLHGGSKGFDKAVWKASEIKDGLELTHTSHDGDQGFPGTLIATVRYTLLRNELRIDYAAVSDKPTVVNLTNHSYFNLSGQGKGTVLNQQLEIQAGRYTPIDSGLIPTGELASVESTPFDFRKRTEIGARIHDNNEQLSLAHGYDHNFVLNSSPDKLAPAASAIDPCSGRILEVLTDQPGIQFYSGNFLDGTIRGKAGVAYPKHAAFCIETQHFPDSPNHPNFPTSELRPGQRFHSTTVFRFGVT
jgi:aldose 1-epimerase